MVFPVSQEIHLNTSKEINMRHRPRPPFHLIGKEREMSHLGQPGSQSTGHIPLRKRDRKNRVFEVNEKLVIQVTTINSETQRKINYSFASEART